MKPLIEIIEVTDQPNILQTIKLRGGKRPGSGQPRKEPTKTIAFRVPVELVEQIKEAVKTIVLEFKTKL